MHINRLSLSLIAVLTASACASVAHNHEAQNTAGAASTAALEGSTSDSTFDIASAPAEVLTDAGKAALLEEPIPAPPADIWERMRAGFQLPHSDHPRVQAELQFLERTPSYMNRVVDRAEPYLHFIVEEVEKRGMPMEIALLPVVESAFQPFAYSPGRAAGLWQFIPATGLHFGLKQNWWYDGRRDVIASTHAALDYLQQLYNRFEDWQLALAAYNSGQGTVGRAVRNAKAAGKPADFWNLQLPRETEGYVPRLLAIRDIVAAPEAYGLSLRSLPDEPYLEVVDIDSQIDLALAAELADLTIEDIYRLNPGYNRWATDPEGPHRLVLPIDKVTEFQEALAALPAHKRVQWNRHKVQQGQTLSHIAKQYNTTTEVIREANQLRGDIIRAGQHLLVPTATAAAEDYVLSVSQRLAAIQNRNRGGDKRSHVVQPGDTLWDIARAHGVSVDELSRWNGMAPRDTLRPGQTLVIWAKGQKGKSLPIPHSQRVYYTVRKGDSLYEIAKRFKVSVKQLRQWNGLPEKGYLQPGQRLTLLVDVTKQQDSI